MTEATLFPLEEVKVPPGGMRDDGTQLICDSQPYCLCVGHINEWDECCCYADPDGKECVSCGVVLIRIHFETGEQVE